MSDSGNKNRKPVGGKKKRLPVFSIVLVACFVLVPVVFFFLGMQEAPGRITVQDASPEADEPEEDVTAPPAAVITVEEPTPVPMPPAVKVRGIYYLVEYTDDEVLERCLNVIEATSLNAIVIDVKDDYGSFTIANDNEIFEQASNAFRERTYKNQLSREAIADMNERGIYTIARIVCFRDDLMAVANPSYALSHKNGGVWLGSDNKRWLDPYNKSNWEYILEACKEAAEIGFDEVQLDYVRFPTDGVLSNIDYGPAADEQARYSIINEFVSYIREEMRKYGVRTSADIFATVGVSYVDARAVGQNVQLLYGSLDSICPMIYPSHFHNISQNGEGSVINGVLFERPDLEPYAVVYNTLAHYTMQLDEFRENNPGVPTAVIRPYLQYFTAAYLGEEYYIPYGPDEIKAQIKAVEDAGYDEWILWTTNNGFDPDVIP